LPTRSMILKTRRTLLNLGPCSNSRAEATPVALSDSCRPIDDRPDLAPFSRGAVAVFPRSDSVTRTARRKASRVPFVKFFTLLEKRFRGLCRSRRHARDGFVRKETYGLNGGKVQEV
jgi:hypothetical protein